MNKYKKEQKTQLSGYSSNFLFKIFIGTTFLKAITRKFCCNFFFAFDAKFKIMYYSS